MRASARACGRGIQQMVRISASTYVPVTVAAVSHVHVSLCAFVWAGKEAQQLNGIGPKIALKIDEILSTVRKSRPCVRV